ncbi:hypothetical protein [Sporisorium scitamineum]|uniref:Uncharacterized protein n=1 Tax=Sporisorium scitamineum TaxID=49012 RepID=A0A0F7RXN2_9BASI|nr:hypothetical protein [Sporisorium scitamineum]
MNLAAGDEALTKRGLLTILLDLAAPEGEPCAKTIVNTGSVSIWIRGITQSNKYPCLDHLGIRKIFTVFLQTVQSREMQVDRYNSNPLDNDVVFPHMHTNLDSQVAAADDGNGVRVLKKQKP